MNITQCPSCARKGGRLVGNVGTPFGLASAGEQFYQPAYRIRQCAHCGLYYRTVVLEPDALARYYQNVDFWQWDGGALFPTEGIIYNFLQRLPPGSRVLDFGCSIGRLLATVTARHECYGVEVNPAAAQVAQSRGITMLDDDAWPGQCFRVIILHDLFEHLAQPTALLQQLLPCLEPGGHLIIATGNADARACRPDLANYWYFRYFEHLCMLGRHHVRFLAAHLKLKLAFWHESRHYALSRQAILRQQIEHFVYWQLHQKSRSPLPMLLRRLPRLKNAATWPEPRLFNGAKDHVVVGLQKG